jgi:hypothetical protein
MKQLILLVTLIVIYLNDAFALMHGEQFKVKVVGIHPNNIVILPRGLEDAVFTGEHIKLTLPNGFIARGVAVRVEMDKSFWKIYRIVKPEYLNRAFSYDLTVINQSEAPDKYKGLIAGVERERIKKDKVKLFLRKDKEQEEPVAEAPETLVHGDIPFNMSDDELYLDSKKSFLEKLLDKEKFKRDMRKIDVSLYSAPFIKESRSDLTQYHYGLSIKNHPKKRYQFSAKHQAYAFSLENPINLQEASLSRNQTTVSMGYHNMANDYYYLSELDHYAERIGSVNVIDNQFRLAPLGIMYRFKTSGNVKGFEMGYVPMLERRESDTSLANVEGQDSLTTVRHSFRANLKIRSGAFELEEDFRFQPAMRSTGESDNDMRNQLFVRYRPNETFAIEYSNTLVEDGRMRALADVNPNNMIHSFNLRLDFSL